jgi:prepilin-type processing-associated H-X9-DG protein
MVSHFGARRAQAGKSGQQFRFNVLHLDGHVDNSFWKETYANSLAWLADGPPWNQLHRPYGWWVKSPSNGGFLERLPMFEGAFDQNAHEFRRASR